MLFFFFKQKTAYEMRISDWSSDVCSSDLQQRARDGLEQRGLVAIDDPPYRQPLVPVHQAALARLAGQYAFDIADAEHLPGAEYRGEEFSRRLGRVDRGGRIEAIVAIAAGRRRGLADMPEQDRAAAPRGLDQDRKSTSLNSSHSCAPR